MEAFFSLYCFSLRRGQANILGSHGWFFAFFLRRSQRDFPFRYAASPPEEINIEERRQHKGNCRYPAQMIHSFNDIGVTEITCTRYRYDKRGKQERCPPVPCRSADKPEPGDNRHE